MRLGKCPADAIALHEYLPRLRHCAITRCLEEGRRLHSQLIAIGLDSCTPVGNLLVHMYGKCGSVEDAKVAFAKIKHPNIFTSNTIISILSREGKFLDAKSIFDTTPNKDHVSWNSLIAGYARLGQIFQARELFDRLPQQGVISSNLLMRCYVLDGRIHEASEILAAIEQPDSISCHTMLVGFAQAGKIDAARAMFDRVPENDVLSWNAMIQAYTQNGCPSQGKSLFDRMPHRNAVSWSSMMMGFAKNKKISTVIDFFHEMPERDFIAWNVLVTAFSLVGDICRGRSALARMPFHGTAPWNSLIQGAIQLDNSSLTGDLLGEIPRRDISSYNLMIQACWSCPDRAPRIFSRMPAHSIISWTALLGVLSQSGRIDLAEGLFSTMPERSSIAWNTMITAFSQVGLWTRSLALLAEMDLAGSTPDRTALSAALDSCSIAASLRDGRLLHSEAAAAGLEHDILVATSLINMYGKCGRSCQARQLFDQIDHKDVVLWTAMFGAYAYSGDAIAVIDLFPSLELEGSCGSDAIALLSVLSACIHAGRLHDARRYFLSMLPDYSVSPRVEHYVCMVDALGRGGQTELADELVRGMPFQADCVAWKILLCACRIHRDVALGEAAAREILELDPEDSGALVQLLCLYEEAGMPARAARIEEAIEMKRLPGRTVRGFTIHQRDEPRREEIIAELRMIEEMIQRSQLLA